MRVNKQLVGDELKEKDLVSHTFCGVCNGKLVEFADYDEDLKIKFSRCQGCGAVSYNRIASQEFLDHMYNNYDEAYDWYNPDQGESVTFAEPLRMAKHILKYIKDKSPRIDFYKIMDFGGGSGVMGYKLAELLLQNDICKKVKVSVVDYCESTYHSENDDIVIERLFPIYEVPDRDYNVIIASAIIEHLPEPVNEMREMFGRLASDGFLYCRMPYAYPLFKLLKTFNIRFDMLYPGHIWDFSPEWYEKMIPYVARDHNIKIILSRPSIPETTFRNHFMRALLTRILKAPWFIFHWWPYVGGWEAIYQRY